MAKALAAASTNLDFPLSPASASAAIIAIPVGHAFLLQAWPDPLFPDGREPALSGTISPVGHAWAAGRWLVDNRLAFPAHAAGKGEDLKTSLNRHQERFLSRPCSRCRTAPPRPSRRRRDWRRRRRRHSHFMQAASPTVSSISYPDSNHCRRPRKPSCRSGSVSALS